MIVVRLSSGELWLWSPVPIDEALKDELQELGTVRYLVAPNRFHHVHLSSAKARFPAARLFGAPGLPEKRKDLHFDAVLEESAPDDWSDEIRQVVLRGVSALSEVVFFHQASGSLITADLFMNVHEAQGALSKLVFWLEGTWKRPRIPRLLSLLTSDRERFRRDYETIVSWPVERVIPAHGEIIETNAAELLVAEQTRFFGSAPKDNKRGGRSPTGSVL